MNQTRRTNHINLFRNMLLIISSVVCMTAGSAAIGWAETEAYIDAAYTVRLDVEHQKLFVTATFTNIRSEKLLIGFSNSFIWSEYDGTDLAKRIGELKVEPEQVKLTFKQSDDDLKVYEVETNGQIAFTLSYTFDTVAVPYDHHFTALTSSTLHIPGLDFFVRFFKDFQEIQQGSRGLGRFKRYTIRLENLPSDWEIVSTYSQIDDHTVVIDDRSGSKVLLSAGKYKKVEISSGHALILLAIDKGLKFDIEVYSQYLEDIFQYYYSIYQHIPESKILMVINQDPRTFRGLGRSFGGQVKKQNIINSLGWGSWYSQNMIKSKVLGHLAHEGHHIWLSHGFQLEESWYWFQEGFTEYISEKTLYTLGIVPKENFERELGRRFIRYNRLSIKNSKNLVQVSLAEKPTAEERDINYDKGMLVAYLLDKQLQAQGKNLEQFLADCYQTYAIPQTPIGNQEIIAYIDEYLGDTAFTEKYVLGTESISSASFGFGWKYYWWTVERYLPPLPFPYNVLVALAALLIVALIVWVIVKVACKIVTKRLRKHKKYEQPLPSID